jgi:hypothetical protein
MRVSWVLCFLMTLSFVSCKNQENQAISAGEQPEKTTENAVIIYSSDESTSTTKESSHHWDDDVVVREFTYVAFSPTKVMKRLNLLQVHKDRSVQTLLSSSLRSGDSLRPLVIETGDGTFDTFALSIDGHDSVLFYFESDVITTIQVISPLGVPADMIGPELAFENLKRTYENPVAYGSEIEGRVFVFLDSISIRLATSYGIYEPIDVEDDTEILLIGF